jgi:hypothetical protein
VPLGEVCELLRVAFPVDERPGIARPLLPSTWDSTLPRLTFAFSGTFWIREECCEISRISRLRVRVKARSSWIGAGGTEARADQPMGEKICGQAGVTHIALVSRDVANVLCIGKYQLKIAFQQMPYWLPVHVRGLHRHMRHAMRAQPLVQIKQLRGSGAKGPCLIVQGFRYTADAGHNAVFVCTSMPGQRRKSTSIDLSSFKTVISNEVSGETLVFKL